MLWSDGDDCKNLWSEKFYTGRSLGKGETLLIYSEKIIVQSIKGIKRELKMCQYIHTPVTAKIATVVINLFHQKTQRVQVYRTGHGWVYVC